MMPLQQQLVSIWVLFTNLPHIYIEVFLFMCDETAVPQDSNNRSVYTSNYEGAQLAYQASLAAQQTPGVNRPRPSAPVGFGPALASATILSGADNKIAASTKTGYSTGPLFMLPEDVPAAPSLVALSTMVIAQEMRSVLENQGLFRAGRTKSGGCLRVDCPALKSRTGVCCIAQANPARGFELSL